MDTTRNHWPSLAGTITASSAAAGLPVTYTQSPDRSKVWRSAVGTAAVTIDRDLGAAVSTSGIGVANLRLFGSGGVLNVYQRGSAGSPGASVLLGTITGQDRDTRAAAAFWAAQSFRHYRLEFTNPGAVSSYVEVGVVHLGTYFEPAVNPTVPAEVQRVDPSVSAESVDGQRTTARRSKYFAGRWQFRDILETQLDEYRAIFDAAGVAGPAFHVLDTALPWTCVYAYQAGALEIGHELVAGRYALSLPWVEVR